MGTEGRWELLNLNLEGLPRLLVKCIISEAGYAVSITDLANIWIGNPSKFDIIANAESQSCSINPGHDAGQLQILLEKIRDVLRHEAGTSVSIGLHAPDDLTLALKAPLPHPLPPFEWLMTLSKAPSVELVSEVISPLLHLAHQQQNQLSHLLGQLRNKDHVMSRLLDKMEATNTDLGSVFPGVSGGRASQKSLKRSQVAKHVPGLAPFQPGSELQHSGGAPSTESLYGILRETSSDAIRTSTGPLNSAWWHDMAEWQASASVSVAMPMDIDGDETDDDLDFQTQTIPEQLQRQRPADISSPVRSSRRAEGFVSKAEDSTDDGRVTSSPPPVPRSLLRDQTERPLSSSPSRRSNTQTRRIGAIGGRSSSQIPLPSSPPRAADSVVMDHGLRTGTSISPTPPSMPPPQSQMTPSRKRRLGEIGRGSSQMQPSLNRWSSQALPVLGEEEEAQRSHRFELPSLENAEDVTEARRTRANKRKPSEEKEPGPRETSVERADRKRQELKQTLDAKPKGPVKRKRRF